MKLTKCLLSDGGSITWFDPPPVETTANDSIIRRHNTSLFEGSTNVELNWSFSLTQELTLALLQLQLGSDLVATILPAGQVDISVSFRGRVNVTWVPNKASLTIFKVSTQDNGEFTCLVNTIGGGGKAWRRKIKVTVVGEVVTKILIIYTCFNYNYNNVISDRVPVFILHSDIDLTISLDNDAEIPRLSINFKA